MQGALQRGFPQRKLEPGGEAVDLRLLERRVRFAQVLDLVVPPRINRGVVHGGHPVEQQELREHQARRQQPEPALAPGFFGRGHARGGGGALSREV